MALDVDLADRLREALAAEAGVTEKAMFGGLAFLIDGHLAVSASRRGGLMLRIDPAEADELVTRAHASRFVMRGREMDGWLHIQAAGLESDDDLRSWVSRGVRYARGLPPR